MRYLAMLGAMCLSSFAWAHGLGIFAMDEGDSITGYVYVQGGGRVAGIEVKLLAEDGRKVAGSTSDAEGTFRFPGTFKGTLTVVAETVDGHRAEFPLSPAMTPSAPVSAGEVELNRTELEAMIARAVAAQVRPLREQLADYEQRVRLTSIVGGIGYIFGIMGLILFFKRRPGSVGAG